MAYIYLTSYISYKVIGVNKQVHIIKIQPGFSKAKGKRQKLTKSTSQGVFRKKSLRVKVTAACNSGVIERLESAWTQRARRNSFRPRTVRQLL